MTEQTSTLNAQESVRFEIPDMTELLNRKKRETKTEINSVLVGRIESFNPILQTAIVSVNFRAMINGVVVDYPQLLDVPVIFLRGGNAYLTFPVEKDDECILLFNDRALDAWLVSGNSQVPFDDRVHDVSDAIALVGIRSYPKAISDFVQDGVKIGKGNNFITIKDSGIQIGNGIDSLQTQLNLIWGALTTLFTAQGVGWIVLQTLFDALHGDAALSAGSKSALSTASAGMATVNTASSVAEVGISSAQTIIDGILIP